MRQNLPTCRCFSASFCRFIASIMNTVVTVEGRPKAKNSEEEAKNIRLNNEAAIIVLLSVQSDWEYDRKTVGLRLFVFLFCFFYFCFFLHWFVAKKLTITKTTKYKNERQFLKHLSTIAKSFSFIIVLFLHFFLCFF